MLTIGDKFPDFNLQGVVSNDLSDAFVDIDQNSYDGKWKVFFFYPKDFTFICPTEIIDFGNKNKDFQDRNCQVLGGSTDSEFVHMAWRNSHPGLKDLPFPLLADIKRELCANLGILDKDAGVALRATFIVDPENVIKHVSVNALNVGRNPNEIIRILDALQTDELTPCNWSKGDEVIDLSKV